MLFIVCSERDVEPSPKLYVSNGVFQIRTTITATATTLKELVNQANQRCLATRVKSVIILSQVVVHNYYDRRI